MSIATYLNSLDNDRDTLAANLTAKGVQASSSETFTTLVPKVLTIPSGGGAEIMENTTCTYNINANQRDVLRNVVTVYSLLKKMEFSNVNFSYVNTNDFDSGFLGSGNNSSDNQNHLEEVIFDTCTSSQGIIFSESDFPNLKKITIKNTSQAIPLGNLRLSKGIEEVIMENCPNTVNVSRIGWNTTALKKIVITNSTPVVVTNAQYMFSNAAALEYADLSGLSFSSISSSKLSYMFEGTTPTNCKILVNNAADQAKLSAAFPSYNFTVKS